MNRNLIKRAAVAAVCLILSAQGTALPAYAAEPIGNAVSVQAENIGNLKLEAWISTEEYGEKTGDALHPLERGIKSYLRYRFFDKDTGKDVTVRNKSFEVKVQIFLPDGTELEPDKPSVFSGQSRSWTSMTLNTPGKWSAVISITGDLSARYTVYWYVDPMQPIIQDTKTSIGEDAFTWGTDNWSFNNSSDAFTTGYAVDDDVMNSLLDKLTTTNTERELLNIMPRIYGNDEWGGSCYGMTEMAILTKQGMFRPELFDGLNPILNQNNIDSRTLSFINLFYLSQYLPTHQNYLKQSLLNAETHAQSDFVEAILDDLTNQHSLINLSVQMFDFEPGAEKGISSKHSVLAYGFQTGTFYCDGKCYDRRILIADPNVSAENKLSDKYCLYYSTENGSWIIPAYNKTLSNGNRETCYWTKEDGTATPHGALLQARIHTSLSSLYDLFAQSETALEFHDKICIFKSTLENPMIYYRRSDGNVLEPPQEPYFGTIDGDAGTGLNRQTIFLKYQNLPNEVFNPPEGSDNANESIPGDFGFWYYNEKNAYIADLKNVSNVFFHPAGHIELKGSSMQYEAAIVSNDGFYETDWFSVSVKGEGANQIMFQKRDDYYVISGDTLQNVTVSAHNRTDSAETVFSTDYKSALICELTPQTIGVMVDTTGDGNYNQFINSINTFPGDINCNGKCAINDAVILARYLAEDDTMSTQMRSLISVSGNGDLDKDGELTAADLSKLLFQLAHS